MLKCYCCCQEFGVNSLPIHLKTCPDTRKAFWKILPENLRKPVPQSPNLAIPTKESSLNQIQEWNEIAEKIYREYMAQCPNCNRRFEPDRLLVHMNHCTKQQ